MHEDTLDGFCSADIMATRSSDGIQWTEPLNLTNTHLINGDDDPVNELYPSMADRTGDFMEDQNLHLMYITGWADGNGTTPERRVNRVKYHTIGIEQIVGRVQLQMPRVGFKYHNYPPYFIVHDEEASLEKFGIRKVYPNPFNGMMKIEYETESDENVELSVFDQQGRVVVNHLNRSTNAGHHTAFWDATGIGAGIYWVRLEASGKSRISKVVLVK
jgi:hypothetical protein